MLKFSNSSVFGNLPKSPSSALRIFNTRKESTPNSPKGVDESKFGFSEPTVAHTSDFK